MRRFACLLACCGLTLFAQKKPFDVDALLAIKRISDPQLSPDGRLLAFVVQSVDVANNKRPKQIYTVPVTGGPPCRSPVTATTTGRVGPPTRGRSPLSPTGAAPLRSGS